MTRGFGSFTVAGLGDATAAQVGPTSLYVFIQKMLSRVILSLSSKSMKRAPKGLVMIAQLLNHNCIFQLCGEICKKCRML